jgi:pimeloyl-ACP methyl ester carboxylesterase
MVLIEPAIVEEWVEPGPGAREMIARGTRLCSYGARAARLGIARLVAALARAGALGAARAMVRVVSRGGLRREDEEVLAPIWKLPREARAVLGDMWTQPKFFEALGSQIEHVCASAAEVLREAREPYGDLPLAVVTARSASERRLRADAALAALSTSGRHILADDSGHWVPLDAPASVVQAIAEVLQAIRQRH